MVEHIGFTGTRGGLTGEQIVSLADVLATFPPHSELHHGDCIGADAAAHEMARKLGWRVVVHPAHVSPPLRANCIGDETRERIGPLDRNIEIVEETSTLIACPGGMKEEIRSGTWQAVRAARKQHRPIITVWPDGKCELGTDGGKPVEVRLDHALSAGHP